MNVVNILLVTMIFDLAKINTYRPKMDLLNFCTFNHFYLLLRSKLDLLVRILKYVLLLGMVDFLIASFFTILLLQLFHLKWLVLKNVFCSVALLLNFFLRNSRFHPLLLQRILKNHLLYSIFYLCIQMHIKLKSKAQTFIYIGFCSNLKSQDLKIKFQMKFIHFEIILHKQPLTDHTQLHNDLFQALY